MFFNLSFQYAGVAELADALALGASAIGVQVRLLSPAPKNNRNLDIRLRLFSFYGIL